MDSVKNQNLLRSLYFAIIALILVNVLTFIRNYNDTRSPITVHEYYETLRLNANETDYENIQEKLRLKINCFLRVSRRRVYQKGQFWVVENFIQATYEPMDCRETITYTTNGEFPYLDNLWAVVERWQAPISLALYCAAEDFENCLDTLAFVRNCAGGPEVSAKIREYLSVHLFFEQSLVPPNVYKSFDDSIANCSDYPMGRTTYRSFSDRNFHINLARNIARDAASTYFILASDIELYPSVDLVSDFLRMVAESGGILHENTVYVLPPFEVTSESLPPPTKKELQHLLRDKLAVRFHQSMCDKCHRIPDHTIWEKSLPTRELGILTSTTRTGEHHFWEPFYIGTNGNPYFDERIPYEGGMNKMVQAYSMCMNRYEYAILNSAFLIHRPGIRSYRKPSAQRNATIHTLQMAQMEYELIYGKNEDCNMFYTRKIATKY